MSINYSHLNKFGYAPGFYVIRCPGCKELKYDVDKRATRCLDCAIEAFNKTPDVEVPYEESLIERLLKRAEIRRQISTRKSVQEGAPDRIADLLEEAANRIKELEEIEYRYNDLQK